MSNAVANCNTCQKTLAVESIYFNVERDDKTMGRREIAEIVYCHSCDKMIGEARSLKSPKLLAHDWAKLLAVIGKPPFYVNEFKGRVIPAGMDLLTFEKELMVQPGRNLTLAPQDRAAGEQEEEPAYEPE